MTFLIDPLRTLISSLWYGTKSTGNEFHEIPRFGQDEWNDFYHINISKVPPIPDSLLRAWDEESCIFWPDKKVKETQIFALVPKDVNGMTLDLLQILEYVQKALPQSRQFMRPYIIQDIIQKALRSYNEAYWVLVTQQPVPGTFGLSQAEQTEYIVRQSNGQYAQVSTMEATVCILAAAATDKHIFGPELRDYTQCAEKAFESYESFPIRVGASHQYSLNYSYPGYSPIRCGAAASRIA